MKRLVITGLPLACLMLLMIGNRSVHAQKVNVYAFEVENIEGDKVSLGDYGGKALLIVNTASRCGFTRQFAPLQKLYQEYRERGFVVLAFPANNFNSQEPGTNEEIKKFCAMNFKTTFPLFAKSSVKGDDINPLYSYLTTQSPFKGEITWNFNKFLVDPEGNVVARYGSGVDPLSDQLVGKLEEILPDSK